MDFSYLDDWMQEQVGEATIEEAGEGYRNIWVVAETMGDSLLPATLEALGQARELADQIGVYLYAVLLTSAPEALSSELFAFGADKVLVVDHAALADYQPEVYVQCLAALVGQYRPEILLLPSTSLGNDLAPRLAQQLGTGLVSNCVKLELDMAERLLLGTFPVLGGEVFHTVACPEARPQMATLKPGSFRIPTKDAYRTGEVQQVDLDLLDVSGRLVWVDLTAKADLPPVPLGKARVVVSAGRGMVDGDGFRLVQQLAQALGGVVAGSRGAFDAGWIKEEQVVGVGGAFIAPDLYVACGLSGDIYHSFAVQGPKFVVAINSDEHAPIMKGANIAVVGDARQVIPALLDALAR